MMKPVMHLNALALVTLTMLGLFSMNQAQARGFGPTPAEIAVLPPFCKAKLSPDPTDDQQFMATFGGGWGDIHHYCYALNFTNRYYQDYADKPTQRDDLNQAMGNYNYMFSHAPPDFWMLPEIHTQKGRLLAVAKRYTEAVSEIEQALKGNPNYAPAYAELSDIYADLGQKQKSVAALEQGLQHAPDTVSLQRRYKQLTGKTFVPPPGAEQAGQPLKSSGAAAETPAQQDAPTSSAVPANSAPAATPEKIGEPGNPYCRFCP